MALANINYQLNYAEDTAYIIIKNDKALLETFFRGLFIVARRHLGYTPNASSYPFITRAFTTAQLERSPHEKESLAHYERNGTIITPDSPKHGKYDVVTIAINGHDNFITKAIQQANEEGDPDIQTDPNDAYCNSVFQALIEDYWNDMLEFAKNNRYYTPRWQS